MVSIWPGDPAKEEFSLNKLESGGLSDSALSRALLADLTRRRVSVN